MSRINYCDEEDYPGQFNLWNANVERSLRGKQGQAELRELRAALLALPEKVLIHGSLFDAEGDVCAIGAYARHRGVNLAEHDPEDATDEVGIRAGMPALVAWRVVALNDMDIPRDVTPQERYRQVLAWVESRIIER